MTELILTLAAPGLLQPRRKQAQGSDVPGPRHVGARRPSLVWWRRLGGDLQAVPGPAAWRTGLAGEAS